MTGTIHLRAFARVLMRHWPGEMAGHLGGWSRADIRAGRNLPRQWEPTPGMRARGLRRRILRDFVSCRCGRTLYANEKQTVDQVWADHVAAQLERAVAR